MFRRVPLLGLLLFTFPGVAQQNLPPRLISAEMPFYPPIAAAAHITGWLRIRIKVENGKVARTEVLTTEAKDDRSHVWEKGSQLLIAPTLNYLESWRFDSDVKTSFVVTFTYKIAGTETDKPTTPKIEVSPSLNVIITARPVRPTVNY